MRPKKRIPIIIEALNLCLKAQSDYNLIQFLAVNGYLPIKMANLKVNKKLLDLKYLMKAWKKSPDLRLSQLLVNMGIIPNTPGYWYYKEESEWIVQQGILEDRELVFWTTYGKEGDKPPKQLHMSEMDEEHILAILQTQTHITKRLKLAFISELKHRAELMPDE